MFVMTVCTQKTRAANPYVQLPYLCLEELRAGTRTGVMPLLPCVPAKRVSALAVAVLFLLSPIRSLPRQVLPEPMLAQNSEYSMVLGAGHAARSP